MAHTFSKTLSEKFQLPEAKIAAVLSLLDEGASIPFIARYRKDATGGLDEVQVQQIGQEAKFLKEFSDRKEFVLKTIEEQGKLSAELKEMILSSASLAELEDLYLPYKPKRKTKAQAAREQGLEPLALWLLEQTSGDVGAEAEKYRTEQVPDAAAALSGARFILAEMMNEDAEIRAQLRQLFEREADIESKVLGGKENDAQKYKDYFAFAEGVAKIPSHRILAILRGFMEGFLSVQIGPEEERALAILEQKYLRAHNESGAQVQKAAKDAYKRLLQPALETELRNLLKARADEEAIQVFAENLRQLLLSPPLGMNRILAIDPGYRTGCKVVVLDEKGDLMATDFIFIHERNHRLQEAENKLRRLAAEHQAQSIAIGDGTAGRETEQFVKSLDLGLPVFLVNEDGASIYSASEIARAEFPDQDITVRGAVSIGRRLMDPLAELVKIDPKSIGVGQYQHDVNQYRLKEKLDLTVESCVNSVGVQLNTSGAHLLQYVSGIGPALAENIVQYRREHGPFVDRKHLLNVPRLGAKAFELSAGFLRIHDGAHPLDASAVHPESYPLVEQMAADLNTDLRSLIGNPQLVDQIPKQKYLSASVGAFTIEDILKELKKPGLDPRSEIQNFEFANIFSIEDVLPGMVVPGIVTNLTRFGAFVDIGVKQDGLVHVSEMAHRYVSDPAEVVKLNQQVLVKVLEVDLPRKRIALSIKQTEEPKGRSLGGKKKEQRKGGSDFQEKLNQLKGKFSS